MAEVPKLRDPVDPSRARRYGNMIATSVAVIGVVVALLVSAYTLQWSQRLAVTARREALEASNEVAQLKGLKVQLEKELTGDQAHLASVKLELADTANRLISLGKISGEQARAALGTEGSVPICYVKYQRPSQRPFADKLAEAVRSINLNGRKWIVAVYSASYQGPGKHAGYVAQIRYSPDSDRDRAVGMAEALTRSGFPTYVNQVSEPGGQSLQFRLWVLP